MLQQFPPLTWLMASRGVLQLDFDGTVAAGDVSTGILARFAAPAWERRIEAASRLLLTDPDSPALIYAMAAGFAGLTGTRDEHLGFAHGRHPVRPGLRELVDATDGLGLECHVVSNGFEYYIRDYLEQAGVAGRVSVHAGTTDAAGRLVYPMPDGRPSRGRFKLAWAEDFLQHSEVLVYAGDGSSDLAPARLAGIVFARDSLLSGLAEDFAGSVRPFDTLLDIAREIGALLGNA